MMWLKHMLPSTLQRGMKKFTLPFHFSVEGLPQLLVRTFAAAVCLRFLGLAAQELGHVQVVCGDIRAYLADILLDLVHHVSGLAQASGWRERLGKLALRPCWRASLPNPRQKGGLLHGLFLVGFLKAGGN